MNCSKFGQFLVWERASRDTIDFKKAYVDMADDLVAGLMLSQIMYWFLPNRDGNSKATIQRDGQTWIAKHNEEWFEECRIHRGAAVRALDILRKKNLIETAIFKFAGAPTVHIRILEDEFMAAWEDAIKNPIYRNPVNGNTGIQQIDLPDSGKSYTESTTKSTTQKQTLSAAADGVGFIQKTEKPVSGKTNGHHPEPLRPAPGFPLDSNPPVKQPSVAFRCTNKLNDAITRKNKLRGRPPNLLRWEAEFNNFFNVMSGGSPREFEEVVDWYIEHINDRYMPDVRSAAGFCEKFDAIVSARRRWVESQKQTAPDEPDQKPMPEIQTVGTMTKEEYDNYIKEYL